MSKDSKSNYYDAGGIEVIEIIKTKLTKEQFEGFCLGNIIKYVCRYNYKHKRLKDKKRDIEKTVNYTNWLKDFIEQEFKEEETIRVEMRINDNDFSTNIGNKNLVQKNDNDEDYQ